MKKEIELKCEVCKGEGILSLECEKCRAEADSKVFVSGKETMKEKVLKRFKNHIHNCKHLGLRKCQDCLEMLRKEVKANDNV